jgi:hypothetical protein
MPVDIDAIREKCPEWDEDSGCEIEFSDQCPFHVECKAEEDKE